MAAAGVCVKARLIASTIRRRFFVYPIRLEEKLPPIDVPLLPGDPPVTLDLQAVFDRCFDAGPYSREIRYGEDPIVPALASDRASWLNAILQAD
jgi:Protein of unknown function (DUF4058)